MKRSARLVLVVFAVLPCGSLVWISAHAGSSSGRAALEGPHAQTSQEQRRPPSGPLGGKRKPPKAVVEELVHDFGILDPTEPCKHAFLIRNEGESPLQLSRGGTSCKCTMSDLPSGPIPPGHSARVVVASKVAQESGSFVHSANIATNDPAHPRITLRIQGNIRRTLAADPPRVVLPDIRHDESRSAQVTLYSQVWEGFTIDEVEPSLEGLKWRIEPADRESLVDLDALSGYQVQVVVPAGLASGRLWERLRMRVRPDGPAAPPRTFELEIAGRVLSRISIYGPKIDGPKIDGHRVLRLGTLRQGEAVRQRLMMTVRDDHQELTVQGIETDPDFLRVSVAPYRQGTEKLGLYRIDVEIPPDAPPGSFLSEMGEIRILTDHPKVPRLTLRVAFAVTSG